MSTRAGICSMCGKEFKNVSQHMINVHKEKEVPCEVCHKTFKSEDIKYIDKNGEEIIRNTMYCHDINGFIDEIASIRTRAKSAQNFGF